MKTIFICTYYHFIMFLRNKNQLFYLWLFPLILFSLFSSFWGYSGGYVKFLLVGVIGMTIMSNSLSEMGPFLRNEYNSGRLKMLQKLPFNLTNYFVGFILTKTTIIMIITVSIALIGLSFFSVTISFADFMNYIIGIILGMLIFSFISLDITLIYLKSSAYSTIINLLNYIILFVSDVFYPASTYSPLLKLIGELFPLNTILNVTRNGNYDIILVFWLIVPILLFSILIRRIVFVR